MRSERTDWLWRVLLWADTHATALSLIGVLVLVVVGLWLARP